MNKAYEGTMLVRMRIFFDSNAGNGRQILGKLFIKPTSPEQADEIRSWNKHCQRGDRDSVDIVYYEKPDKSDH